MQDTPHETRFYRNRAGKVVCHIGPFDLPFFESLQKLPAYMKITMMHLTEEEMLAHIKDLKEDKLKKLFEALLHRWEWLETGEPVIIEPDVIPDCPYTEQQLRRKCKSGNLTAKELDAAINFFTGPRTEVRTVEQKDLFNNEP